MSDRHLDPPEHPEPPECPACCEGFGDWVRNSADGRNEIFTCDSCCHEWSVPVQKVWEGVEEVYAMEEAYRSEV